MVWRIDVEGQNLRTTGTKIYAPLEDRPKKQENGS